MKIVFTGANTRGNAFSVISLVDEIRTIYLSIQTRPGFKKKSLEFFYVGSLEKFNTKVFSKKNIFLKDVYINEEGETILGFLFDIFIKIPFGLPFTFFQSLFHLIKIRPDILFSKGGYDSAPIVIAAWLLRIPIFIHESNAIPTRANYMVRRFSTKIFISYSKTANLFFTSALERLNLKYYIKKKIIFSGVPIRKKFIEALNIYKFKQEVFSFNSREFFNFKSERPVILFLNESSPAIEDEKINDFVLDILPELLSEFEIIHLSGDKNYDRIKKETTLFLPEEAKKHYHLYSFLDEKALSYAYSLVDLIITRGGANTIFEIAMFGKASIIIPLYDFKSRYQITNAYLYGYEKPKTCLVIEEVNFLPRFLWGTIRNLFNDREIMDEMAKNSKQFAQPEATNVIIEEIFNFLAKK